jgi:hypothetical protein
MIGRTLGPHRVTAKLGAGGMGDATSNAVYANGYLLCMREDTLPAQPFDPSRRSVTGTAVAVASGVQRLVGELRAVFSRAVEQSLLRDFSWKHHAPRGWRAGSGAGENNLPTPSVFIGAAQSASIRRGGTTRWQIDAAA